MAGGASAEFPRPDGATLSIVIPAFDEEARLATLFDALARSAGPSAEAAGFRLAEVVVVDDGSTDRTREMLVEAGRGEGLVKPVLDLDVNRGKGAAVALGAARAEGDFVLFADVDLSTPLEDLSKLSAAIREGADIAVGSRAVAGAVVERGPAHRKLMGKAFNATVRALTGLELHDTQCGFKLMPTEVGRRLLAQQRCSGFAFDVELLMRASAAGLRIAEVPVTYVHDSRSRVRVVGATFEMLREVTSLARELRRQPRQGAVTSRPESLSTDNPD
jgi:dolichyl-phosphate beta-glucosyltransferase